MMSQKDIGEHVATRAGGVVHKQHLDDMRRTESLRGAETTEVSVPLGNNAASHCEGSA
jgi:hypothetical protein